MSVYVFKLHLDDTRVSGAFNANTRIIKFGFDFIEHILQDGFFPRLLTVVIAFRTCRGRGICSGMIIGGERGRGGGGAIGDNKIA